MKDFFLLLNSDHFWQPITQKLQIGKILNMIFHSIQHIPLLLCKDGHFWGGELRILSWETISFFFERWLNFFIFIYSFIFSGHDYRNHHKSHELSGCWMLNVASLSVDCAVTWGVCWVSGSSRHFHVRYVCAFFHPVFRSWISVIFEYVGTCVLW